ncbi:MAG: Wzz/FepE/Etk N-terminal domain-containing protein [Chloroflexota bacterium]|nr:Wzz/FepE/Etk N-terminal domain-containing protein [Chloroflexota bacterium]
MELSGYLAIVRRWAWLIVIAVALAAVAGYAVAATLPRVYESQARLLVGPINADLNTQRAAGQLALTYAELVTSQPLLEATIADLALPLTVLELERRTSAAANDVTRLVTIRVVDGDPHVAATIANALAARLLQVAGPTPEGGPAGDVAVIEPAQATAEPIAPRVPLIVLLAAGGALIAILVVVVAIEHIRDRVHSPAELSDLVNPGAIMAAPALVADPSTGVVPEHPAYRRLVARLELEFGERRSHAVLITGAHARSGAGVIASNVILGFSSRGYRSALVDLSVADSEALQALAVPVGRPKERLGRARFPVFEIHSGTGPPISVILGATYGHEVGASDTRDLLGELSTRAEVVVIAAPPIQTTPDVLLWAKFSDAAVIAVPRGLARRRDVLTTVETLRTAGANITSLVVTQRLRIGRRPALRPRVRGGQPAVIAARGAREPGDALQAPD